MGAGGLNPDLPVQIFICISDLLTLPKLLFHQDMTSASKTVDHERSSMYLAHLNFPKHTNVNPGLLSEIISKAYFVMPTNSLSFMVSRKAAGLVRTNLFSKSVRSFGNAVLELASRSRTL